MEELKMEGTVNLVFEIQAKVQCPVECGALCYYCMCSASIPSGSQTDWVWAVACFFLPVGVPWDSAWKSHLLIEHVTSFCLSAAAWTAHAFRGSGHAALAALLPAVPREAAVPLQSCVLPQGQGAQLLLGWVLRLWHWICCLECEALMQFLNGAFTQQHRQHKLF